jgi:hypothetical protein
MKFNIYNRYNKPTEVDTEDKEISTIEVILVNWNEIIWINYKGASDTHIKFPYKYNEDINYSYIVPNKLLKYWIELEKDEIPEGYSIGEYRLEKITKEKEE